MSTKSPTPREVFSELLENCPREEWDARLAEIRQHDAALAERVEKLLRAHLEPQSFLDRPLSPTTIQPADESAIGQQIGPYKLREQIGEGGFGVVYVAEQTKPIRRKVALKIIKPGMDSKEIIARFEAERQALALMDHPNIAKVLDAATTETGRPYFVMELVRGVPITEFCDKEKLTTEERLRLFTDVCRAVQHAHQKGIIHRDLKPTNVLVTLHDGKPVPKVIDFGVAKALSQQLTEHTLYTAMGQMVGTPMYMSPEQAEMSGLDVDTRSDVYSLGVLLYELLTGNTPFDRQTLKEAGLEGMRRIIRETEPVKPSARISTLKDEQGVTISDKRRVDTKRLEQALRGDLDWVVMKALEKDRNRRYASPSDMADDIERQLANQPIEAGPPSALYRARKYCARHKVGLAAAILVLLAMFAGTGFSVTYAIQAIKARDAAENAEELANERLDLLLAEQENLREEKRKLADAREQSDRNFTLARQAVAELIDEVARRRLIAFPELAEFRESLLKTADRFYSDLLRESPGQASLLLARAAVRRNLNRNVDALEDYLVAVEREPDNVRAHLMLSEFYRNGANHKLRDADLALQHNQRAVELDPDNEEAWYHLAWVYVQAFGDKQQGSQAMLRSAELTSDLAEQHYRLGIAQGFQGRYEEAIATHSKAIALGPRHCHYYIQRGQCYEALGQLDEAVQDYTRAMQMDAFEPLAIDWRARCLMAQKDYERAARDFERVLTISPDYDVVLPELLDCYQHLGNKDAASKLLAGEIDSLLDDKQTIKSDLLHRLLLPEEVREIHTVATRLMERLTDTDTDAAWTVLAEDEEFFAQLTRLMPDDYRPWEARARAFAAEAEWDRAAADYAEALRLINDTQAGEWWSPAAILATRIAQEPELFRRVSSLRPEDDRLSVAHIREYTANGQFEFAADELAGVVDRNPGDIWAWFVQALLQNLVGDSEGYRRTCDELLARTNDSHSRIMTSRACLLTRDLTPERLDEIQDLVNATDPPSGWERLLDIAAGLLAYRRGDFAATREQLALDSVALVHRRAIIDILVAMADFRLGSRETARQRYDAAVTSMETERLTGDQLRRRMAIVEWLMFEILRREAADLMQIEEQADTQESNTSEAANNQETNP